MESEHDDALCCRDTTRLVSESRERALTAAELESLEQHLRWCERCQVARRQFAQMFAALETLLARGVDAQAR